METSGSISMWCLRATGDVHMSPSFYCDELGRFEFRVQS
jgi:hypothetical protein